MRLADRIPTTVRLECKVLGCGHVIELPVVYRLEPVPGALPGPRGAVNTRLRVDIEGTLALELPLRLHLDEHAAAAETGLEHPDDPGPTP